MAKQSIQNLFKGDLSRQQVDFDPVKKLEQSSRRVFDPYVGTKQILPADSGTNEVLNAMTRFVNTYKGVQEKEVKAEEEARTVELKDQYAQMSPEDRLAVINGAYQKEQKEGRIPIGGQLLDRMVFAELNGVEIGNLQYKNDLYANIERLADPTSGEDAAAYEAKRFQELSEGLNHFQKKGLQSVRDKVRENFLYEASRKYSANLNAQANQTASREVYRVIDEGGSVKDVNNILNTYYNDKTGRYISADDRAELIYKAYQNKAQDLARDGRIEEALILLDDLNNLKAGQDSVYNMRRSEIQALKDSLPAIDDEAYNQEIRERTSRNNRIADNANKVQSIIVNEQINKEELSFYNPNSPENMEDIMSRLRERGVSEDELLETAQDVATKILRYSNNTSGKNNPLVVQEVRTMIRNRTSFDAIQLVIDDAQEKEEITPLMAIQLTDLAFKITGDEAVRDNIESNLTFDARDAKRLIGTTIEDDENIDAVTNTEIFLKIEEEIEEEKERIIDAVRSDEKTKDLPPEEQSKIVSEKLRNYTKDKVKEISQAQSGFVSSENESVMMYQKARTPTEDEITTPPELEPQDRSALFGAFTSPFRNRYFEHNRDREEIKNTKDKDTLKGLVLEHKKQTKELYNLALERVKRIHRFEQPKEPEPWQILADRPQPPTLEEIKEYFQAKSIVGLTTKELQEGKTDLGFPIPERLKDPMYVIMLADFKGNVEDLSDTDVEGLLEFLPGEIRQRYIGKEGIKLLVKHQGDLLTKYRTFN
tara:strand:+ start:285 stop:2579 length:2295 start_codon:yes stop_codon:yes gene_type:complete